MPPPKWLPSWGWKSTQLPTEVYSSGATIGPEATTIILMKGHSLTYLQTQYRAFEQYGSEMEVLREQIGVSIVQDYWKRAVEKPLAGVKERLEQGIQHFTETIPDKISVLPQSQHNLASEIWQAGSGLATEFVCHPVAEGVGMISDALSDYEAPNWPLVLHARLCVAQEYAKAVGSIANMPLPSQKPRWNGAENRDRTSPKSMLDKLLWQAF